MTIGTTVSQVDHDLENKLTELASSGVYLAIKNGKLKVRAEQGALTEHIKSWLQANKSSLLSYFEGPENSLSWLKTIPSDVEHVPCSFAQTRIWLTSKIHQTSSNYNMPFAVKAEGNLNLSKLRDAFAGVLQKHSVLRTTFYEKDGLPYQQVNNHSQLPFNSVDLSQHSSESAQKYIENYFEQALTHEFDLTCELPIYCTVFQFREAEFLIFFNVHHIAFDGWSGDILIRELINGYLGNNPVGQRESLKEDSRFSYYDFAYSQHGWLDSEAYKNAENFWNEKLNGAPMVHQLPTDFARQQQSGHEGKNLTCKVPDKTAEKLEVKCREFGVTKFSFLQSVFALLLARLSQEEDILVGTQVAGRNHKEIEGLIGFFVNTVPLRSHCSLAMSFNDFLMQNNSELLDAFSHQDFPFEAIVEKNVTSRKSNISPLVQIMFSLREEEQEQAQISDLSLTPYPLSVEKSQFELVVNTTLGEGDVKLNWTWDTSLFKESSIQFWSDCFNHLLGQVLVNGELPLGRFSLSNEQAQETFSLVQGIEQSVIDKTIYQQFLESVSRNPFNLAIKSDKHALNFAELKEKVDGLAQCIGQLELEQQNRVGIFVPRSEFSLISVLACSRVGLTYVPLDINAPTSRLQTLVQDAEIEVVLCMEDDIERAAELNTDYLAMPLSLSKEKWFEVIDRDSACVDYNQDAIVYALYTSGSTGNPKGVEILQLGLNNYLQHCQNEYLSLEPEEAVLSSNLHFDATVTTLFPPIFAGKTLVVLSENDQEFEALKHQVCRKDKRLLFKLTPTHLEMLCYSGLEAFSGLNTGDHVQHIFVVGGEKLTQSIAQRLKTLLPGVTLINEYGPTETVVGCCVHTYQGTTPSSNNSVPIGKPICNTSLIILDQGGNFVPPGAKGELHIAGKGLAKGYLNLPVQTERHFKMLTLADGIRTRTYKTGDLVRQLDNQEFEFLGRVDEQIKLRGYRIEPAEIEHQMLAIPGIKQAKVKLVLSGEGDDELAELCAFATVDESQYPYIPRLLQTLESESCAVENVFSLPNGMDYIGLNKLETEYLYDEIIQQNTYLQNGISLREGDVIVDVGANIGLFSCYLASLFESVQIHSVEPIPAIYEKLKLNAAIFGPDNIHAHNIGLSDQASTTHFNFYPKLSVFSGVDDGDQANQDTIKNFLKNTLSADNFDENLVSDLAQDRLTSQEVEVRLQTLSQLIADTGLTRIDLLKIDVERSELNVLKGINERDWEKIRQVVVEVHQDSNSAVEVESLLVANGFEVVKSQNQELQGSELYNLFARKASPNVQPFAIEPPAMQSRTAILQQVSNQLSKALPEYMVPASIHLCSEFPLTRNGKVDSKKLDAFIQHEQSQKIIAPRNETEYQLMDIWRSLLSDQSIGVEQVFFSVGGQSLLAMKLINEIRHKFNLELRISDIFQNDTIALQAVLINNMLLTQRVKLKERELNASNAQKKEILF